jgi:hypothetical protein
VRLRRAHLIPRLHSLHRRRLNRLAVLSFSALLFHLLERRRKRPLVSLSRQLVKKRMWARWRGELKREGQLRERERVVKWRKALIKKRQVIVHWYL